MPTNKTITLYQRDDPAVPLRVLLDIDEGQPYNLTGKRIDILVKAKATTSDDDAMFTISSAGLNPGISILDAANGLGLARFTNKFPSAGTLWYHATVADESDAQLDRLTWAYGLLIVPAV